MGPRLDFRPEQHDAQVVIGTRAPIRRSRGLVMTTIEEVSRHMRRAPLLTPDGRYLVVRGRLWRASNPSLDETERQSLVDELMNARRAVAAARRACEKDAEQLAHAAVDRIKRALGERGPVWWDDGAPDLNRHMARNTSYAAWFAMQD